MVVDSSVVAGNESVAAMKLWGLLGVMCGCLMLLLALVARAVTQQPAYESPSR